MGKILSELSKTQKRGRKIERKKPWRVLTRREMQVAKLMVEGHSTKVMAEELFIAPEKAF